MNWREVEFGIFPSSQRRGGCGINKSREATEEAADGREARARQREAVIVVSSAKCLGMNSFAELTTPAAPISERIHLIDGASTPPLRGGEYSAAFLSIAKFIHTLDRPPPPAHSSFRMGFSASC